MFSLNLLLKQNSNTRKEVSSKNIIKVFFFLHGFLATHKYWFKVQEEILKLDKSYIFESIDNKQFKKKIINDYSSLHNEDIFIFYDLPMSGKSISKSYQRSFNFDLKLISNILNKDIEEKLSIIKKVYKEDSSVEINMVGYSSGGIIGLEFVKNTNLIIKNAFFINPPLFVSNQKKKKRMIKEVGIFWLYINFKLLFKIIWKLYLPILRIFPSLIPRDFPSEIKKDFTQNTYESFDKFTQNILLKKINFINSFTIILNKNVNTFLMYSKMDNLVDIYSYKKLKKWTLKINTKNQIKFIELLPKNKYDHHIPINESEKVLKVLRENS